MRFIILFALLGCVFASQRAVQRIVGGSDTTIQQYPYMVNMQYAYWGFFWSQACGGSLISSRTVLSAAHCFYEDSAWEWRAALGSSLRAGTDATIHSFTHIVMHEHYDDDLFDNDIAVLILTQAAVFNANVQSVSIAGFTLPDNSPVTAIGYGSLLNANGPFPTQLQHVQVNVINQELCHERYLEAKEIALAQGFETYPEVNDGMFCSGILDVGGRDACQGDSGGPVAYNGNILVGITSWGAGCAAGRYPGVNARVSYYVDWILANSV